MRHGSSPALARGFTLIELVLVIVLSGILAGVLAGVLHGPVQGYVDLGRRARLVDLGESALARMTRELRLALPNSVRVKTGGGVSAVELLRIFEGGRYRAAPVSGAMPDCASPAPGLGDPLELACPDPTFDVLGRLERLAALQTGASCQVGAGYCVVVYNTGQSGANAYAGDNLASVSAVGNGTADDGSDQLTLASARLSSGLAAFPLASPAQRFYVVDTPVSFVCDPSTGRLTRHQGYPIAALQALAPGGSSALLVNQVSACEFSYTAGTQTRGGIARLRLTLSDPASGEDVSLLQQVRVENTP